MKPFLLTCIPFLIFAHVSFSQTNKAFDYNKHWQTVTDFEKKALPQSALKEVDIIYTEAKKTNNMGQFVKALIHQLKYTEYKEEEAFEKNMEKVKAEILVAKFPTKQILHSMLAEMYWQYYTNNRWKFNDRTATVNFEQADIATWSLDKIVGETQMHYQLSLGENDKAKKINIEAYNEIINGGNELGQMLRPMLYDFLAHCAADFFMGEEPNLTQPAYAFKLDSESHFADAATFATAKINSKDTSSMKLQALQILQTLIQLHLQDKDPSALVDADIKRLKFVYQHSVNENKQALYMQALQQLEQKYIKYAISTLVSYEIAKVYQTQGALYAPLTSDKYQFDLKKAYDIAEGAVKRFPKSFSAGDCRGLMDQLRQKNLQAEVANINIPNQPFLIRVSYRNLEKLRWCMVKTTKEELVAQQERSKDKYGSFQVQKFVDYFLTKTPASVGSAELPSEKDFQQHSTEVKINGVGKGTYLLLLTDTVAKVAYGYQTVQVSNLSYLQRNNKEGEVEFYVWNRKTGDAIEGVKAKVYRHIHNNKSYKFERVLENSVLTNKDGAFTIPISSENYKQLSVDFEWQNDFLSTEKINDDYHYGSIFQSQQRVAPTLTRMVFFTDRAIYRPGQTIYFKGLCLSSDGKTSTIVPQKNVRVALVDNNGKELFFKELSTNEYGTIQGSFTAPSSGSLGEMQLSSPYGSQSISVEEYKRAKFEVVFEPIKISFRLGDSIAVKGHAKAYSGANIDGAKVKYRVVRKARFPAWWCFWRGYYPDMPEVEIANGTAVTDEMGKYSILFTAQPDLSIDKNTDPTFSFTVYADVTDLNGETHSNTTTIDVGYKAITLSVPMADIDKVTNGLEKREFPITTKNLAGESISTRGSITIYKLKTPDKAYKTKLWERCDKFAMSKEQYQKDFQDEAYNDEDNIAKWEKELKVFTFNFDTEKQKSFVLNDIARWNSGQYVLEAIATDSDGQEVKDLSYFKVYSTIDTKLAIPQINYIQELKTTCEPGDTAKILFGTASQVNVLYEIERDGKIIKKQWLGLNNEQRILQIPIIESYRGNIVVYTTFILENRFYHNTTTITVPYTNKELDISFETFRDKLQPGEKEQWKIKIKGKTADKIAAEMVATLYDASLEVFRVNSWEANFFNSFYATLNWTCGYGFNKDDFNLLEMPHQLYEGGPHVESPYFNRLNWFGYDINGRSYEFKSRRAARAQSDFLTSGSPRAARKMDITADITREESAISMSNGDSAVLSNVVLPKSQAPTPTLPQIQPRKNFKETAFFYPSLYTNEAGEIIINFTIPEALTRWKMLGFAHTKDLKFGLISKELITQKELMVVPNQPRFFRENDQMQFSVKITSLSDKLLTGQAQLQFFDALTMKSVNIEMKNQAFKKDFSVAAGSSTQLEWAISIPEGLQAVTYRVVAQAGNFSDGEEMTLPVVTNRMMVTEAMPMSIRGKQTKTFHFDKLKNNTSTTLRNHKYTLEFTSNPAWNAVLALPYLMEYPSECVEQMFSRFYANSIASHVANANPKIKKVFDTWATIQPDALLSNLEKNQELKSALLEETPWVLQAKDESQRKRNVALLFDLNRMGNEMESALDKLRKAQTGDGGFTWFPGMPTDYYMTQHIVAGLGHLNTMGVKSVRENGECWQLTQQAVRCMDNRGKFLYDRLNELEKSNPQKVNPDKNNYELYFAIQYLYARSYFPDLKIEEANQNSYAYYIKLIKKSWNRKNLHLEGMICLALHRAGETATALEMIKSFKERALHSEEMGMYWKTTSGYYWYEAPIETQALMIEVFDEVAKDAASVEELKIWLLKQKQTQDWKTTKATAAACYALLRKGSDFLASDVLVDITVGTEKIDPIKREETKVEAGTGYFKTSWTAPQITPDMGNVTVTKKDDGIAWGAVYWQYFEQLDKITRAETPLKLNKKLFLEKATDRGPVITPIGPDTKLQVGNLIKVRIELRADRNMEYIHLKDMRAAALEPVTTLSTYKYQDGLGYYESTRDLATNFFIGYLPKGTYVFEYPLRVSQKGDFSNGVTTVQSMYAPEFTSHSEGVRIIVK